MGFAMRPDVGAVGARLYYGDDTIQHAGVIIGWGGVAGHAFVNQKRGETGYQHRIICQQDMSAVTAACMLVPRLRIPGGRGLHGGAGGGLQRHRPVHEDPLPGYLIVYNPFAEAVSLRIQVAGA